MTEIGSNSDGAFLKEILFRSYIGTVSLKMYIFAKSLHQLMGLHRLCFVPLGFAVVCTMPVYAQGESLFPRSVLVARNLRELNGIIEKRRTKEIEKRACLREIQQNMVPRYCYRVHSFDNNELNSMGLKEGLWKMRLDFLCEKNISNLSSLIELNTYLDDNEISLECHNEILKRKEILLYKLQDT
ncbi:MAG: hypothetical protein KDD61_10915 [Bdellovibrionales bacterium]|nr:hypothetical protein [Bdellovibrionales bacterium]